VAVPIVVELEAVDIEDEQSEQVLGA